MGQAKTNKLYRTFVKGLVTEASPLTYPEDTSFDELNTVPSRRGNRTRRFGVNYSSNNVTTRTYRSTDAHTEYVWTAVASKAALDFLVIQNGAVVSFYDRSKSGFEETRKPFTIDLSVFARPGVADVSNVRATFASGKGFLFCVSPDTEPLVISYDSTTDSISAKPIIILSRDFEGLSDGLANDEEPPVLTKEHHYNLQNQGWVRGTTSANGGPSEEVLAGYVFNAEVRSIDSRDYTVRRSFQTPTAESPIFAFRNKIGRFPGNNKQWWVARADADDTSKNQKAGDFLPAILNNLFSGNNRAPRGHYVLNQFRKDRSAASGISDIPVEELGYRPGAVTFFSGRAWYAGGSSVYYSQILDTTSADKAGLCYQEADPTAEDISELIASDGGMVPIPEADNIVAVTPLGNGVMVFANNGVWFISGGDSAFSALNISVSKISPVGTKSPQTIVETDGTIFWWSELGIQAIQQASGQFGPIPNRFGNTNIAEQTIQTFYNNISPTAKHVAKGLLDPRNNLVYWLYSSADQSAAEYDSVLIYDITLQAFYPWKFSTIANGPRVNGMFVDSGYVESGFLETVKANDGTTVRVNDEDVSIRRSDVSIKPSSLYFLTQVADVGLTVAAPVSFSFVDWEEFDGVGATYDSYITTGFELNNDAMRNKQITYLFVHFRRTEDDFGNNLSSCRMTARWDWSGRNTSRWSSEVEVYRPRTMSLTDVVVSKNKVRGHGKSVQFRFGTSERGRTFDLLGWAVGYSGVTES